MGTIQTEAWVLHAGIPGQKTHAELCRETFSFPDITDEEVLVEPIYGCWEGNMTHALRRDPIDICLERDEPRVVIGNAGIVRILDTGAAITHVEEGDLCVLVPAGQWNEDGYVLKVFGYEAEGTVGLLAKRTKLRRQQFHPIPKDTVGTYLQWAATSVRYATAWANWKVAFGCWRLQHPNTPPEAMHVWGWGGGVSLAEVSLAKHFGCQVAMLASKDERLALIQQMGIQAIDRRRFAGLDFDEAQWQSDRAFKKRFIQALKVWSDAVRDLTGGANVAIFVDNIGAPVIPATLRALAHRGVVTTTGWKHGMRISLIRANECINHHIHVHTHGCPFHEIAPACAFSEKTGWGPPVDGHVYSFEEIPQLAADYEAERVATYFPLFQVNPL